MRGVPTARSSTPPPVAGCSPLFDAAGLREADRRASADHQMPSILLMERAGLVSAREILNRYPAMRAAIVLVGPGNNGGDGMVVARHLAEAGWSVRVMAPGGRAPAGADAATMVAVARTLGIEITPLDPAPPAPGTVIVDALLGTGASGAPRGELGRAVEWLAGIDAPVVALDIPSGVDGDTGAVAGAAVRAQLTITYHGDMPGLRVAPGAAHAGEVVVADIGIPSAVAVPARAWRAGTEVIGAIPVKGVATDKYAAGATLIVAGAPGLTGAACLAARASLRAGGGLTVVAAPAAVQPLIAAQLVEIMCAPLPDEGGSLAPASVDEVVRQAERVGAIAVGPGIGRARAATAAVAAILRAVDLPAVVDADGLWHLAALTSPLPERAAPTVLTPHTGEAARLLGVGRAQVEAARIDAATELATRHAAVVVLKGPGTLIAAPDGRLVVNGTGSSVLATAGTGDVLTGVIAAHLSKGMEPFAAAVTAVAVHGRAGDLAGRGDGTIASDLIEALPLARAAA